MLTDHSYCGVPSVKADTKNDWFSRNKLLDVKIKTSNMVYCPAVCLVVLGSGLCMYRKRLNWQYSIFSLLLFCNCAFRYQVTARVRRNPTAPSFSRAQYSKVISELFPLYTDIGLGVSASDFDGVSTCSIVRLYVED